MKDDEVVAIMCRALAATLAVWMRRSTFPESLAGPTEVARDAAKIERYIMKGEQPES